MKNINSLIKIIMKDHKISLIELSRRIITRYFILHPDNNYTYFTEKKVLSLLIELTYILANKNTFKFSKLVQKIDQELKPLKEKIFNKWISGKLERSYQLSKNIYYKDMLKNLMTNFGKEYNVNNELKFKQALKI